MPDDDVTRRVQHELIVDQLYKLSLSQTEAIMQLTHALRTDRNVSEQTREEAEKIWANIGDMIDALKIIAKLKSATDPKESPDE